MIQAIEKQQSQQQQGQYTLNNVSKEESYAESDERQTSLDFTVRDEQFTGAQDVPAISISNLFGKNALSEQQQISLQEENKSNTSVEPCSLSSIVIKRKKPRRSILFGAAMGAVVACWVFSGNFIFTALFTLMTVLGQLEFYRMAMCVEMNSLGFSFRVFFPIIFSHRFRFMIFLLTSFYPGMLAYIPLEEYLFVEPAQCLLPPCLPRIYTKYVCLCLLPTQ